MHGQRRHCHPFSLKGHLLTCKQIMAKIDVNSDLIATGNANTVSLRGIKEGTGGLGRVEK